MSARRIAASCALSLAACTSGASRGEPVQPRVVLYDGRDDVPPSLRLKWIIGTYGPLCDGGPGWWSLRLADVAGEPEHPPLMLVPGDDDCELTVVAVITGEGERHDARSTPPLSTGSGSEVITFGDPPVVDIGVDVDQGGGLNVMVSDPNGGDDTTTTRSESFTGTSRDALVPAPDYLFDLQTVRLQTDARDVVLTVDGAVTLTAQTIRATGYAVAAGAPRSYDALHAAYERGSMPMQDAIPASELLLLGADLTTPQVRTLVIASVVSGVPSYQAIAITFSRAAR